MCRSDIAVLERQSITNRYCNHSAIDCNRTGAFLLSPFMLCVPTLNHCPTIYERCLDLSAYLKLSGAPGTWLLRLHLVYIKTSGSSDMPYMICDVLVVFLERHILSYVLFTLFEFSQRLCIAYTCPFPVPQNFYYPNNGTFHAVYSSYVR